MKKGKGFRLLVFVVLLLIPLYNIAEASSGLTAVRHDEGVLSEDEIREIEVWIEKNMKEGKIPGASVVIVKGDKTVYNKGFGYADIKTKRAVESGTLFELGSASKAFTALGILRLERRGLIDLNDPVSKYLPWFTMRYSGEYKGKKYDGNVDITLSQLLYHSSGIPFKSIGDIPAAEDEDALLKTVRTQVGKKLDFYPGEKFQYATINYDILGLIIEEVTGMTFEAYMEQNILNPLQLNNTYLFREESVQKDMAAGHKLGLLLPRVYDAPVYRGNTPAGYFITNSYDMEKWLKIQLGTLDLERFDKDLIEKSHIPDRTVAPGSDGSSYASGWFVFQDGGGEIAHGGNNPNFSSSIIFRPQEGIGVAVLANLNSAYTGTISQGIMSIITGKKMPRMVPDTYKSIDNIAFTVICVAVLIILAALLFLSAVIAQIIKRERKFNKGMGESIKGFGIIAITAAALAYCLYKIPEVLYYELPWSFIDVWAPGSFKTAIYFVFSAALVFSLYYYIDFLFSKPGHKDFFSLVVLSLVSGFGNALIIFIINEALSIDENLRNNLLLYFAMGIVIYIFGQKLVRSKMIRMTNEIVYQKRMELINSILHTSYQKFEEIENEKLYAGLNNDTETISSFAGIAITGFTSIVTLICCFLYLGVINFYGLLISMVIITISAGLYFFVGRSANRIWEQTRDAQNVFFKFINDLVGGYKELSIHNKKLNEFRDDMEASCNFYKRKRIEGALKFVNVFVIGELLFTFVIGAVAFIFPVLFPDILNNSLRNYIFVFLYMTAPVHGVLDIIPNAIQFRISWNRLTELLNLMNTQRDMDNSLPASIHTDKGFDLVLEDVEYSYKNSVDGTFTVGPVSCTFRSGEIIFITGGNGSGKSTLAKLVTGLYKPDKGAIYLNDLQIESQQLSQMYSAVFSDYYLFEKLYGIDHSTKREEISKYLKILCIDDKTQVNDGRFSTTKLSSGQRKRLALLLCYLENRPIYIFDEWAADQDPEFRRFFYYNLLPELREEGKCIIAITHDDRYFDIADKIIKMDMGMIIEENQKFVVSGGNKYA